jgi:hypothetical protein
LKTSTSLASITDDFGRLLLELGIALVSFPSDLFSSGSCFSVLGVSGGTVQHKMDIDNKTFADLPTKNTLEIL